MIYNDGYIPFLSTRHPSALGISTGVVWAETWDVLLPISRSVLYVNKDAQRAYNEMRAGKMCFHNCSVSMITLLVLYPQLITNIFHCREGQSLLFTNQELTLTRNGYKEEGFFRYSISPLFDEAYEGGISGSVVYIFEETDSVLNQRRFLSLNILGAAAVAANTMTEVITLLVLLPRHFCLS